MNDCVISQERISWQASLREFHQMERDDEALNKAITALETEHDEIQSHGAELEKELSDALKVLAPIDLKREEMAIKVDRAKTLKEKNEALRKEQERSLGKEMQFKDNRISTERETMEHRFKREIEREERKWERERLRMRLENETFSERLVIAAGEIKEMMKSEDEKQNMKKEHYDHMVLFRAEIKAEEEKWRVEMEKILIEQTQLRTEMRHKERLWAEERKDKTDKFRKKMAEKEMNWKNERHKLVKLNRTLALKSSFTEHWIKDLEEQIRTVGTEILETKKSLVANLHGLEERCLALVREQAIDPEPVKLMFRTKLSLADMMPSANRKNSVWKIVDGWK